MNSGPVSVKVNKFRILSQVNLSGAGKGTLKVDAGTLAAGACNYSLLVNGKTIGARRMVLTK